MYAVCMYVCVFGLVTGIKALFTCCALAATSGTTQHSTAQRKQKISLVDLSLDKRPPLWLSLLSCLLVNTHVWVSGLCRLQSKIDSVQCFPFNRRIRHDTQTLTQVHAKARTSFHILSYSHTPVHTCPYIHISLIIYHRRVLPYYKIKLLNTVIESTYFTFIHYRNIYEY